MNKLLAVLFLLVLSGCNSNPQFSPTVSKPVVVVPDQSMYTCPLYKQFPNADTLTDVQVAKVIVNLYKNNVMCKNSIESIRKFLEKSKETIENENTTPVKQNYFLYFQNN